MGAAWRGAAEVLGAGVYAALPSKRRRISGVPREQRKLTVRALQLRVGDVWAEEVAAFGALGEDVEVILQREVISWCAQ